MAGRAVVYDLPLPEAHDEIALNLGRPLHLQQDGGFGTPGNRASPIVGMNCGGTRTWVACS